ncbi:ROK family transcriptional regulator [Microbacterium sp.]|uniref:ROK family transcriptional regulator n=1 Tax=Microbacterium sp. TaxID=51671 RepID=UPI0028115A0B|nr:ROK family transcriptional regulator [Microbacterium sp.]
MLQPAQGRATTSGRLLDLLRTAGTLSRVELADATGLAPATITNAVRTLIDAGLVREVGTEQQSRGQPRRLLRLEPDAWYTVGVQLDRATTSIVAADFTGRIVASAGLVGAGARDPEAVIDDLRDHVAALLRSTRVAPERVIGVGLVTHGPQNRVDGTLVTNQPTPRWRGFPLTRALSEALALPVLLENDAMAAAIGEQWGGSLPTEDFGLVYVGSGIGGAVIIEGEPYRGRASNGVEIGHIALGGSADCSCGKTGCVEAEAAPPTVVARACADPVLAADLELRRDAGEILADFERIARAAKNGDDRAGALVRASAAHVARAALVLAELFDVDTIVLAGPALGTAGPQYREAVEEALQQSILRDADRPPRALLSPHAPTSAAIGAALHVLRAVPVALPV